MIVKKCGIVTIFDKNYNYGGQLQAYAMCKLLQQNGCESKIVSFDTNGRAYALQRLRQLGIKETAKRCINKLRFRLSKQGEKPDSDYNTKISRFDSFMEQIPHTKTFQSSNIGDADRLFDFYVCGSDQIWNPGWWNDIYFLRFTNKPKFSYAASIGRDRLSAKEQKYIQKATQDYIGISVREKQAEYMLAPILEKNVVTVLDPTFMLEPNLWEALSSDTGLHDYALIYKIGEVTQTAQDVYKLCHNNGIKVYAIGHAKNTYDKGDNTISDRIIDDAGPKEWLGLIKNASYIFTDSFHGTVFSILFKKKFWCFEKKSVSAKGENTRLYNLLSLLGLEDRFVSSQSLTEKDVFRAEIPYTEVYKKLEKEKECSRDYVLRCLQMIQE